MITTRYTLKRYLRRHRQYESYQVLLRERLIGDHVIWTTEIDREEVPTWATLELGLMGRTKWRSRLVEQHSALLNLPNDQR